MPRRRFLSAVLGTPPGAGTVEVLTAQGKDLTRPGETKDILDATGAPLLAGYYAALGRLGVTGLPGRAWTVDRAVREGYARVVWVYRAVEAIGGAQSRLPIVVLDDRTNEPVEDHPLPAMLNSRKAASANALESGRVYRKRLSQQVLLSPRGAFTYAKVSRGGTPLSYRLLPPDRTRLIPDSQGAIDHYEVDPIGGGKPKPYPADQVRWTREPHPTDPFAGMTPLEAAGLTAELDHFVRLYNRQVLANDGRPGGIVGITNPETGKPEAADPKEMDRVEKRFAGGPLDAGRLVVLDGTVSYTDLGGGMRDGAYSTLRQAGKDEILVAFATPESQIGRASGSTFANAAEEKEAWYLVTVLPHVETVDDTYVDEVDDGLSLSRDLSSVDVLDRAAKAEREEKRIEVQQGLRTPLSYAQETDQHVGDQPGDFPDVPATRALWFAGGKVPVAASDDDTQAAAGLAAVGSQPPPAEGEPGGGAPGEGPPGTGPGGPLRVEDLPPEVLHALFGAGGETKRLPRGRSSHLRAVGDRGGDDSDDAEGERDRVVASVTDALSTLHARLVDRSLARLRGVKARQGTRHWVPPVEGKQLDPDRVVDQQAWADAARTLAETYLPPAAEEAATALHERLADSAPPPGPVEPTAQQKRRAALLTVAAYSVLTRLTPLLGFAVALEVAEAAAEAVEALVKIAVARSLDLRTRIVEAEQADAAAVEAGTVPARGVSPVVEAIREWAAGAAGWAQRTAEETAAAAVEGARHTVLTAAGDRLARVWRTRRDSKVRPAHRRAEGQTVHGADPFLVGGEAARYPGDPRLSPGNRINCRCRVGYSLRVAGQRYLTFGAAEAAPDLGTKALLGMRVGPMPVEVKAGLWDAHAHPRDRHGRFIRVAEFVRLASGETGRVLSVTAGTVEVRTDAGHTVRVTGREVERVDRPHVQLAGVARSAEHLAPPAEPEPSEVERLALTLSAAPDVGRLGAAPVIPEPPDGSIDCVTCGRTRPAAKFPTTKPGLRSTECRECRDARRAGKAPRTVVKGGKPPVDVDPVRTAREALRGADYHSDVKIADLPEVRRFRQAIEHNEEEYARGERMLAAEEAERDRMLAAYPDDPGRTFGVVRRIDRLTRELETARDAITGQKAQQGAYMDLFRKQKNYDPATDTMRIPGDFLPDDGPGPVSMGHLSAVMSAGRALDAEAQRRITEGWEQAGIDEESLRVAVIEAEAAVSAAIVTVENTRVEVVNRIFKAKSINYTDAMRDARADPEVRAAEERLAALTDAGIEASRARREGAGARAAFAAQVYGDLIREVRPTGGTSVRTSLSTSREPGYVDRPASKLRKGDVLSGDGGTAVVVARVVPDPSHGDTVVYYEHAPKVEVRLKSFESVPRRIRPDDPEDLTDDERDRLAALTRAAEHLPTGWLDAMNDSYLTNGLWLASTDSRGHYSPIEQKMVLSPRPPSQQSTRVGGPLDGAATHELTHVAEQAVPFIRVLEWAFMWHRTSTGKPGKRKRVGRNALKRMSALRGVPRKLMDDREVGRGDKFPEAYSGREYLEGPAAPYELLTTINESLFHGDAYADEEMRAFGLGMLATVGEDPAAPVTLGEATVPGRYDVVDEPDERTLRAFYSGLDVGPPRYAGVSDEGDEPDELAWYSADADAEHRRAAGEAKAGVARALGTRLRGHEEAAFDLLLAPTFYPGVGTYKGGGTREEGAALGDPSTVVIYNPADRVITFALRMGSEEEAAAQIAEHNAGLPDDVSVVEFNEVAYRGDDPALAGIVREAAASALVSSWAMSSNDAHVRGLALQRAVVDELGIGDPHPWNVAESTIASIDADYTQRGALYRAFIRAQYDETQKWLDAHGIRSLTVHRGFNFTDAVDDDPDSLPGWVLADEDEVDLSLRPASSFSVDPTVAAVFAEGGLGTGGHGAAVTTVVPANRILSTPRTGWGCLAEQEVVILAGPTRVRQERYGDLASPDGRAEVASAGQALSIEQAAATPAGALRTEDDVVVAIMAEQRTPTTPERRAALARRALALGVPAPPGWESKALTERADRGAGPGPGGAYPSNATEDWLAPIFDVRRGDGTPVETLAVLAAVTALPRLTAARVLLGSPARSSAPPVLVEECEAALAG